MSGIKSLKSVINTTLVFSFLFGITGGMVGVVIGIKYLNNSYENRQTLNQYNTEDATIQSVKAVLPSVVNIIIYKNISEISNKTGSNIFPFDDFFDIPFNFEFLPREMILDTPSHKQQVGGGSGFIISKDGLILTNKHVVDEETTEYMVILNDGREFEATVIDQDPFNDIAIMKIEASDLPVVTLGNSDTITIGQSVIAIGNSLGEYQNSVTKGIVSGINRRVFAGSFGSTELIEEAIQTDAAINPGNSGGPLINLSGEVIGINTAISRSGQLVGFAIPINTARYVVASVLEFGKIVRPWLGVRYVITSTTTDRGIEYGATLLPGSTSGETAIIPDSPAHKAGLQEGDTILKVNGESINNENPLGKVIGSYKPGDTVQIELRREDIELTISVTLEEFEN